jgi:transposase, IS30 family
MNHAHLTPPQRYQIEQRFAAGQSRQHIALAIGVHRATIYRELSRGSVGGVYEAQQAQRRARWRQAKSAANHPMKPKRVWQRCARLLRRQWTPEEIAGRLRAEGLGPSDQVSAQALYDWLRRTASPLVKHLRRYRALPPWRPSQGGLPAHRPRIRQRPIEVRQRLCIGHWEGDTIVGRNPSQCLVTLVERKSLFLRLSTVQPKQAQFVARALRVKLRQFRADTLTLDNGSEFAQYATLTEHLGTQVYFADPGKPRQRARNEYTNGLIRQYIPKGTRLDRLSPTTIRRIEHRLNHRPRKSLGYKTPHEVFFNLPLIPFPYH